MKLSTVLKTTNEAIIVQACHPDTGWKDILGRYVTPETVLEFRDRGFTSIAISGDDVDTERHAIKDYTIRELCVDYIGTADDHRRAIALAKLTWAERRLLGV